MNPLLREIPQISKILSRFGERYPPEVVKKAAREVTQRYRKEILEGRRTSVEGIYEEVERRIRELLKTSLRRVINATGVVVNTNLGRAPLHGEAIELIQEVAGGYSNLEYDLCSGTRGSRNSHVEGYLLELTGAEAGFVVNNNAGAVYLVLNTLACGREVVISRGELVEIGGSFRIPDIMRASGAILREVGTTNRTRLVDYEEAIGESTALLMKVHRSNFYMEGFVEEVELEELARLGRKRGIPTYYDAGSGLIIDLGKLGLPSEEITFREAIGRGADLVSGSGDKLLGGPQAGIIVGRKRLVEAIRKNPMARALRIDKLTLAGLEITLRLYLEGRHEEIPVIRMLTQSEETIKKRAFRLKRRLKGVFPGEVSVVREASKPGGGALPRLELPTYCVALKHPEIPPHELHERLRKGSPPVVGRVRNESLLLDMRTVSDEELGLIERAVLNLSVFSKGGGG